MGGKLGLSWWFRKTLLGEDEDTRDRHVLPPEQRIKLLDSGLKAWRKKALDLETQNARLRDQLREAHAEMRTLRLEAFARRRGL